MREAMRNLLTATASTAVILASGYADRSLASSARFWTAGSTALSSRARDPAEPPAWSSTKGYLTYSGLKLFKIWGGILSAPYTLDQVTGNNNITFMERAAPQQVAAGIGAGTRSAVGVTASDPQWWASAFLTGPAHDRTSHDARQAAVAGLAVFPPVLTDSRASLLIGGNVQYLFDAPVGISELNLRDQIEMRIDGSRILGTGALPIASARV